MKKLFIVLFMLFFVTTSVTAKSLKWDPAVRAEGYIVYYTDGDTNWNKNVGNVSIVDIQEFNLTPGDTYSFHVTAYNSTGESDKSNTLKYLMTSSIPTDNIKPITIIIPGPITITIGE